MELPIRSASLALPPSSSALLSHLAGAKFCGVSFVFVPFVVLRPLQRCLQHSRVPLFPHESFAAAANKFHAFISLFELAFLLAFFCALEPHSKPTISCVSVALLFYEPFVGRRRHFSGFNNEIPSILWPELVFGLLNSSICCSHAS